MAKEVTIDIHELYKIFPNISGIDRSKLKITDVGIYSTSRTIGSCFIAEIIMNHMKSKNITITDGTGNVGSETIVYSQLFKHVNVIELDKTNFDVLKHNITTYKLDNVTPINGDSLKELPKLTQDVIVLDAPWGGPSYSKHERVRLYMSNIEISDIVKKYWNNTKLFILKVPRNYDLSYFSKNILYNFKVYNFISSKDKTIVKFKIIVLENFDNDTLYKCKFD
jgi:16S rRNA G966 N2-methylase RsmD